jgi:hypothetical protein
MPVKPYKKLRLLDGHSNIIDQYNVGEPGDVQFAHSGLINVSLPYRSAGASFSRQSGPYTLSLTTFEPSAMRASRKGFLGTQEAIEVAWGGHPRIILLALQTRAIVNQSPEVNVEPSFTAFAKQLGLKTGGRTIKALRKQMLNLAFTSVHLEYFDEKKMSLFQGPIFSELHANLEKDSRQRVLWPDQVRFSHDYFRSLQKHAVPLDIHAIRALQNSPRSLDFYQFCAYRLHSLNRPKFISWYALQNQFSDNGGSITAFRRGMIKSMEEVEMVYPEAVMKQVKGGIKLFPSFPPISKRVF